MIQFVTVEKNGKYSFSDLVRIMSILRGDSGCPWDREQTHGSIRSNFIEEVYEAAEAIDLDDPDMLCEELGDVLLQVVFHARISEENRQFDHTDITDGIVRKLLARHPHIFGDVKAENAEEVLQNWEKIKRREKSHKSHADSVDAVAKSLPALIRAEKVQSRAAKSGFDFTDVGEVYQKLAEETAELKQAADAGGPEALKEEIGDLLFTVVNLARLYAVEPEDALSRCCDKFARRFRAVEEKAAAAGRNLEEMSQNDADKLWDEVKNNPNVE